MIYFITGTDTGVGKTCVTALLATYFAQQYSVGIVKPIQTGYPKDNDCEMIRAISRLPKKNFFNPLHFNPALAPQQAAERDHEPPIDAKKLVRSIRDFAQGFDITLVEGAGGLYVPIRKNYFMIDLIRDLKIPVILVTRTGLGTINHTLLSAQALRQKRIKLAGVIPNTIDAKKDDLSAKMNAYIMQDNDLPVLGVLPRFSGAVESKQYTADMVLHLLPGLATL